MKVMGIMATRAVAAGALLVPAVMSLAGCGASRSTTELTTAGGQEKIETTVAEVSETVDSLNRVIVVTIDSPVIAVGDSLRLKARKMDVRIERRAIAQRRDSVVVKSDEEVSVEAHSEASSQAEVTGGMPRWLPLILLAAPVIIMLLSRYR